MTIVYHSYTVVPMMTLDAYMKSKKLTDQRFGDLIGVSRLMVLKYRLGRAIPGEEIMKKIVTKTDRKVQPNSFYQ